jgi:integrase
MQLHAATFGNEDRRMSDELVDLHLNAMEATGKSPEQVEIRACVLRQLNRWLPYGLVYAATEQIEAWYAELRRQGKAKATLSIYPYHVRCFYKWATAKGYLDGDPASSIERTRPPRSLPKPVTEDLLARLLELPEPARTAIILAGFGGLRASECARCEREHITEEMILIPIAKGGDPATVPTHPYIWQELHDRPPGPLILNRLGRPVDGGWVTDHIRETLIKTGLRFDERGQRVHLHRMRHRFGTVIQAEQGDLRLTQECMRHRSIASTTIYTLVTPGRRAAAVAALPVPGEAPAEL